MVLAVGAADGCAVYMAKNIMQTSSQIKHAVLLQVRFCLRWSPDLSVRRALSHPPTTLR
jgi:hypothetical protein